jgi:hypothetical protein
MAMLRDGLRAELPELFRLAGRLRPIAIPAMSPWVAAIAAFGMRALTDQLLRGTAFTLGTLGVWTTLPVVNAITIAANACAILFAFGSARWRGVASALALFGAVWLSQFVISLRAADVACGWTDPSARLPCGIVSRTVDGLWWIGAGAALGLLVSRVVRTGERRIAVLAFAFGITSLAYPVTRVLVDPYVGVFWHGASTDALHAILAVQLIAALVLGAMAGTFGRARLRDAAVIAAFYLLPWLPQFEVWRRNTPVPYSLTRDWQWSAPVGYTFAALAALAVAAMLQQRGARRDA